MAVSGQDWRRHQSHRPQRSHRNHPNHHQKLISTATLTLFVLFLSSWIAYAAGKATVPAPAPLVEGETESSLSSSSASLQDFNSSSAFLGAIASASASASGSFGLSSMNSSPIAIVSYQGITSTNLGDSNTTLVPLSDTPLLIEEFAAGEFVLPPLTSIFVSIVLLIVILGTVVGNVLVCIAVCMGSRP